MSTNITELYDIPSSIIIFKATFLGTIIVLSLILNTLTLIILHRMRDMNPITRVFLTSMTVTDLCSLGYYFPIFASTVVNRWPFSDQYCTIVAFLTICLGSLYCLNLPLVNFERFIAVTRPFQYTTRLTVTRARATVITLWSVAAFSAIARSLLPYKISYSPHMHGCTVGSQSVGSDIVGTIYTIVLAIIPLCLSIYFFIRLYTVARHHARQIQVQERSCQRNAVQGGSRSELERKTSVTFFLMTVSLVVCMAPKIIVYTYENITAEELNMWFVSIAVVMSALNTIINVIIYYWRTAAFRKAARDIILAQLKRIVRNELV
ncbi:histamine H2 receptor-like [Amphiura filiformis]|uniref:histamine H2 receptor-like n=1 Tax=Amphiura filiformis TaxID=82378 RepID=UPI003B2131F5